MKDKFQELPRIGSIENMQGCKHNISDGFTTGTAKSVYNHTNGMPRRSDGKMYCHVCNALDYFKELFLTEYKIPDKSNGDHHLNYPVEHKFPVYMCRNCGNIPAMPS